MLDPAFRPAVLAVRAFNADVAAAGGGVPVRLAIEQADGSVFRYDIAVLPASHPRAAGNAAFVERFVKFLLWSRGGWRIHVDGPADLTAALAAHYTDTATGRFDAELVALRMFDHPIAVVQTRDLPPERSVTRPLGRHLDGCRIGFDLGGSDRKVAAVVNGEVVYSEETVWDPYHKPDPQYHFDGIMDSLRKAAEHLPRVDAIGGSAAGVYVNSRVKAGSLFRGVPQDLFDARVKDIFLEVRQAWQDVPFEVVNDGEVTALAGSMSLGKERHPRHRAGHQHGRRVRHPGWQHHVLAQRACIRAHRLNPDAPVDEWSGDFGVGSQYFSQQAVGRLAPLAGIETPADMGLPEKLKVVQKLRGRGPRGREAASTRRSARISATASRTLPTSTTSPRARARPRDLRAGRR